MVTGREGYTVSHSPVDESSLVYWCASHAKLPNWSLQKRRGEML
jgi:hypothetical protein